MNRILLGLALLICSASMALGQRTVSGKVTDENGDALIGVTVTAPGTRAGTQTGADGTFSLQVPATATVLKFSYTGYESLEVPLTASNVYDVTLSSSASAITEVVVVGYGTQQKRAITGNVATVRGQDIASLPAQSFDQLLQGRAVGVNVNLPNGVLNNPPVFRVRGINSINLSSFPLVVIDGVPTFTGDLSGTSAANNALASLNPNDIESIDILKDASAAAIYGSRASAGVVLITTKRGKKGKTRVQYDAWAGFTQATRLPEMMNALQYVELKNEAAANAGLTTPRFFLDTIPGRNTPIDTRWADYVYRRGFSHNHALSFSGGTEQTTYYLALGYTNQEGMIIGNDFSRLNGRLNLDHNLSSRIKIGGTLGYTKADNFGPNSGSLPGQAFATAGAGRLAFVAAPIVDPYRYDANGNRLPGIAGYNIASNNQLGRGKNLEQTGFYNPTIILDLNKHSSESNQVQGAVYGQLEIIKNLSIRTQYGIDNINVENITFWNPYHGDGFGQNGYAANTFRRLRRWNWQNILSYDVEVAEKHKIGLLAGHEEQYTTDEGWGASRSQIADPFFTSFQGNFTTINPLGNFQGENYLLSYFGRINYEFNRMIYLTANLRQDEYSAFAPGRKRGTFWGASAGFTLSELSFWQEALGSTVNFFKIRGSYGTVGNNLGIGDFASQSLYASGLYGAAPTFVYNQAGNPLLSWETSEKTDVGVVFGLFNDRIQGEYTYFVNNIDGLIQNAPQAPSKGIPGNVIAINIGSMVNTGHEFGLSGTIVRRGKFSWSSNANITFMRNEVKSLYENSDVLATTSGLETTNITRVGKSVGSIYAVETRGVNPDNGRRIFVLGDGTLVQYNHAAPAGQRWTKVSDGSTSRAPSLATDGKVYGPAIPKWFGGWDNTFTFGNLDLNIQMNYAGGYFVYNGSKAGQRDQRFWNNAVEVYENRWTENNKNGTIPRVVFGDNISNGSFLPISENVEKGDFLRIRNITLGYRLPARLLDRARINSLRIYANVNNAFLFTGYTGTDPEVSTNGNSNTTPGVDRNSVPMAQSFTVGINLGL